jgi:hypothetical protein
MQAVLDTALERGGDETRERLALLLAEHDGKAGDATNNGVLGLSWESDLAHVRRTAARLWAADLDRFRTVESDASAPHVVTLRWLVAGPEVTTARGGAGRRVGPADVERLHRMRCQLKAMDNAHGGGAAFPMAVTYLRREVAPLLNGRYVDATGRQLFSAVAGLTLDVGWMAYDAGDHRLARGYLGQCDTRSQVVSGLCVGGSADVEGVAPGQCP